ncbi:hypothetical protein CRM22_000961, partial [Opisthorchis felineus]
CFRIISQSSRLALQYPNPCMLTFYTSSRIHPQACCGETVVTIARVDISGSTGRVETVIV